MGDQRAIGVFDSGIGGLTVLKEIQKRLPHESLVYLGDTARVPYGAKSKDTIIRYSINNTRHLLNEGVKMLVVACNTASAYALEELEKMSSAPVIGVVEGGVMAAVRATSGKVGVIGTEATVRSGKYVTEILKRIPGAEIVTKPCPLFVALAEEGWTDNEVAHAVAKEYLKDMEGKIDTLVLGCTHYPVLKNSIRYALGENVKLIDSAEETSRLVEEKLRVLGLGADADADNPALIRFLVTDSPERNLQLGRRMLGDGIKIDRAELVDITWGDK
ncbi:MAG: glutamate racemase [Nitrospinae bacterium]|nr:glutamate racemase [Nitrospinota bacterium]